MEQQGVRQRRIPPPGLGEMLSQARMRAGWRRREAARILGVSPTYLFNLEAGLRAPSRTMAQILVDGLYLGDEERALLLDAAVADAGADSPWRHSA